LRLHFLRQLVRQFHLQIVLYRLRLGLSRGRELLFVFLMLCCDGVRFSEAALLVIK